MKSVFDILYLVLALLRLLFILSLNWLNLETLARIYEIFVIACEVLRPGLKPKEF